MARLLVRTAFANLRSRRLQTWLMALILAAASATLALAVSLRAGAADPYEKIARATNAADVHLLVHRDARADLAALAHARGVRAADGPFRIVGVSIRSRPSNLNLTLEGVGARPRIDRPKVTDGRWLSGAKGEVVLDRTVARDGRFRLGQRLTTVGPQGTTLTVVGFAMARGGDGSWGSPEPRLRGRGAGPAFLAHGPRRYRPDVVEAWDWRQDRQDVIDRTSTSAVVLGSASLAALLAVGFIVANAIGGRILASRRDIGLLKAAGFTPGGVTALFVLENLILAGAASVVGTAVGIALSPLMLEPTAHLLGTAPPSGLRLVTVAVGVLGVVGVVCVFTAMPAWRAGRLGVLEAIALGRSTVSTKPSRAARAAAALRFPPAVVRGVRTASPSRSRAAMTIASLALTMGTVIMALGTEATYRRVIQD